MEQNDSAKMATGSTDFNNRADTAVVKLYYAEEEARELGYAEFESVPTDTSADDVDPTIITDSARWANILAPKMRCMAGYGDTGRGTYTVDRKVAAVLYGSEEDEPAAADLIDASAIYEVLVEKFYHGAHMALSEN
jgi:hypothetical protein